MATASPWWSKPQLGMTGTFETSQGLLSRATQTQPAAPLSFFDRLRTGFEDNPNALGALGMSLLAHRQNAVANPLGNVAQNFMLGSQIDSKERLAKREESQKEAERNATAEFLVSKGLAKDYDIAKALPVAVQEELIKSALNPEKAEAPWVVSGDYKYNKFTGVVEPLTAGGPKPEDLLKTEIELRKEFSGRPEVKDATNIHSSYKNVRASASLGTGAGDIGLVYNVMKMLDPGAHVMEGEYATASNAGGVPAKLRNYWNKLQEGDLLDPVQRREMVELADKVYGQSRSTWSGVESEYNQLASEYQVNPDRVTVGDMPAYPGLADPTSEIAQEMKRRGLIP